MNNRTTEERLNNTPGSKTHSFTQNQLASKVLTFVSFLPSIMERIINIYRAINVVAHLTRVE